ncbi:MAG: trypsin-like peptidase domain-containing protein [Candidatus Aminicenantes bacterium]|nr:MAG: trypsin-like peptidase domain-containing protein [Candidatus Aminicenantes bacterium]
MKKLSMFFAVFLSLSLVFAFAGDILPIKSQYRETLMERSPGKFDPAEYSRAQQETFDWLMAEAAPLSPRSIITVQVTAEDLAGIESYECETCGVARKLRVGLVKPLGVPVSFSLSDLLASTPDGGFVWTAAIVSPKATALRVHFTNFSLPNNAALYIYNLEGEAFGPYIGSGPGFDGDFWTNTVTGSVAYVQLRHFGSPSDIDLKSISFNIAGIGYLSEKFRIPFLQHLNRTPEEVSSPLTHCPDNEDCVEDASCFSGGAIGDAKHAAAYIQWVAGAWIYMCSGGLIADTDTSSQIPYFLTANHCISKARNASNLEAYFQYWTASCHGACYDPVGVCPRTLGSDIVKTGRDGDYSLLQLWENPPSGSVFLGWNSTPLAFADGTELFRISHPSGMPQAYSEHVVDSQYVECGGLPIGQFIYSQDVVGATEGGSSGSPVMNMTGQIVGQLYGACGYTLEVCDFEENRTVDGAFAYYFDNVKQWLDPNGGPGTQMHVDSIVLSLKAAGPNNTCKAVVTIVDENNNPVEGATVTGTFSGDASGTESGVTDASGEVTLSVVVIGKGAVSTFTFCVDSVTHASLTYDPAANVETCDTY